MANMQKDVNCSKAIEKRAVLFGKNYELYVSNEIFVNLQNMRVFVLKDVNY